MAIVLEYLKNGQGVLYRVTHAVLSGEELIAAIKDLYASFERIKKLRFAIVDYRRVQHLKLSQSDIQQIVALNMEASRISGSVIVATITSTRLVTTLVQQWEILIEKAGWELKFFFRYSDACEWIRERVAHKFFIQLQDGDFPQYADEIAAQDSDPDIETPLVTKWQRIVDLLCDIAEVPVGLIMQVYDEHIQVFVSGNTEKNPYSPGDKEALVGSGVYCKRVIETRAPLKVTNALQSKEWTHNPALQHGLISYLGYPLHWPSGEIFGTICILDVKENSHNSMIERLIREFRDIVETHLSLVNSQEEISKHLLELSGLHVALEKLAQTDELTGLLNRKTFQALLAPELARRSRSGAELCFCLCDIDHFKDVNDSYGHDVGDVVLKTLTERLKSMLRAYDVIWRWGGEEFLIMCPDSTLKVGRGVIERLRVGIEQQPVPIGDLTLKITMSFGVTAIQTGEDIASCLKRCDELLYIAKEQGRNRVAS